MVKVHDVCAMCSKACKQPYNEWDLEKPEKLFCKNFERTSNLPYETLEELIVFFGKLPMTGAEAEKWSRMFDFLKNLRTVYIKCVKCDHMIAPDELYQIENEEAVCLNCEE